MSSIADPSVDEAAVGSINDAAGYCRTLWVTFIGYAATIFILTSGTTHEALLRRTPVKLPLFNVDSGIPLLLFYVIAPLLLVLFHLNLLMKLHDLRVRISELILPLNYVDDANAQFERSRLRRRLMAFDYAVLKAGLVTDRRERVLLRVVTDATIFIMPVLLLLFVQLQFLPYHDWKITWLHRLFVFADLGLIAYIQLWLGRPAGSSDPAPHARRLRSHIWRMGLVFALPILISLFVLAFPGEPQDGFWETAFDLTQPRTINGRRAPAFSARAGADFAEKFGIRRSLYLADRALWAEQPPEDLLDALNKDETIIALHGTQDASPQLRRTVERIRNAALNLRGRNLSYANFENATLIAADFTPDLNAAEMRAYVFNESVLNPQATFFPGGPKPNIILGFVAEPENGTDLRGATFSGADLRGALMKYIHATGSNFAFSNLQSADFSFAELRGTDFGEARMQEANLTGAKLEGADLSLAQLQGANLRVAQLDGARLRNAQLQNADLMGSTIGAAQLADSQWEGASLDAPLMEQLGTTPSAAEPAAAPSSR
jgi:uncharacterized protein YjbI with pentapeptide repeats